MEVSSKLKAINSENVRLQVHITNVPTEALKRKRNNYVLKIVKKYTFQKVVVKIELGKNTFQGKRNISNKFFTIEFDNEKINLLIEVLDADKYFTKRLGRYRLTYLPIKDDKISIKVKSSFNRVFYNEDIIPRIKKIRNKSVPPDNQEKNRGLNTSEDLQRKDFKYADQFPYHYSPNSDGDRTRREVFGGRFSGTSRSGGKRRR